MNDIETRIRAVIDRIRKVKEGDVAADQDLFQTGILDSMATLEYIAELETEFGIAIPNEDLIPQNLWSIAATAALVGRFVAKNS